MRPKLAVWQIEMVVEMLDDAVDDSMNVNLAHIAVGFARGDAI